MISEEFQRIIDEMSSTLGRTIGVIDPSLIIIASSDKKNVGNLSKVEKFDNISTSDFFKNDEFTYKYFGGKESEEFAVFVSGIDDIALSYVSMLSVTLTHIVKYYNEKNSKITFIKNLIFDNTLPGEINYKIRTLKIPDVCQRACFIVHSDSDFDDNQVIDGLREMFPDATRDFIIDVGDHNIVLIKDVGTESSVSALTKLANAIVCVLSGKYYLKVTVGVGTVSLKLSDLSTSFRNAQVALEVRKVFDNEKSVAVYYTLGIARLIYQLPTTLCESFLQEVFKKCSVSSLDRDLTYTINKFFENNLNVSETSRHLFVHRNTLVYRLEKIRKLTGLDLRNFEDSIVFKISLMVDKYLRSIKKDNQ